MAERAQMDEIIARGREDGAKLFKVATGIYRILIFFNWIVGVAGVLVSLAIFSQASGNSISGGSFAAMGFATLVGTAVVCLINYAFAVLSTHGAKVLVHILFANLALLPGGKEGGQA